MDLVRRMVVVFATLAVGIGAGWWMGHTQPQGRIDDLVSQLSTKNEQLEETRDRWELSQSDVANQLAETKGWKAKTKDLRPRLAALRLRTEPLKDLGRMLVPAGATMNSAQRLQDGGVDLLVVNWTRDDPSDQLHAFGGLRIYQFDYDGLQLIFDAHPNDQQDHLIVGDPQSPRLEESSSSGVFLVDTGDVTGDGFSDLAIQDWNHGTGGCGAVRVLETSASGLRQIFHRQDCDHHIYIKAGSIGYRTALSPPGCSSAHGCGWKRTWMRWTGVSWAVTNVRRKLY